MGLLSVKSSTRRRVRGFGAAGIVVAILVTNFNLRKIAAFISDKVGEAAKRPQGPKDEITVKTIRRRDRDYVNPYTNTYPAGFGPHGHDKPTKGTEDQPSEQQQKQRNAPEKPRERSFVKHFRQFRKQIRKQPNCRADSAWFPDIVHTCLQTSFTH